VRRAQAHDTFWPRCNAVACSSTISAAGYVNLLRSIPLILVVFWFYFLVPLAIGRAVGAFPSALIAFTMFEAAYYSEIIRAGIQGVARGQLAAAEATASPISRPCVTSSCLRRSAPCFRFC